jgi:copper resistance protein C
MTVTTPLRSTESARRAALRSGRLAWLAGAVIVFVLALPARVTAHAALDTINPADKSSGPAPTRIVGTFLERPDPAKSSFAVVDAGGTVIVKGGTVPASDPKSMTLALPALAPGAYQIRWTTISLDDGETAHGITTFTVVAAASPSGSPSAAPSAVAASQSALPSPLASASPQPTPAPSATPAPTASTSDALIPIIVVVILVVAAGAWLLRGRSRATR